MHFILRQVEPVDVKISKSCVKRRRSGGWTVREFWHGENDYFDYEFFCDRFFFQGSTGCLVFYRNGQLIFMVDAEGVCRFEFMYVPGRCRK